MGKLIPILLAVLGTGAGVGAGFLLEPAAEEASATADAADCQPAESAAATDADIAPPRGGGDAPSQGREYVKLANQFVVPIMGEERVEALVIASLSVEVGAGESDIVYAREPKLRDAFLQALFDHANIGGFDGAFTSGGRMQGLRKTLFQAARGVMGSSVSDVLITEIARQDG
jgi:hypothetical protein